MKNSLTSRWVGAFLAVAMAFTPFASSAQTSTSLSGYILLQVQENGEAWYVVPATKSRVYLGRPDDAFNIMREFGIGISNENLAKFAVSTQTVTNTSFAQQHAGKIFLQVEENGEAWYINPRDLKRYFLGSPADAFNIMSQLGVGITNETLAKISIHPSSSIPPNGDTKEGFSQEAVDLQLAFNGLLTEYVALQLEVMRAAHQDYDSFEEVEDVLFENAAAIGDLINEVYGTKAEMEFNAHWQAYAAAYLSYAEALELNNTSAANTALSELAEISDDLGDLFEDITPDEIDAEELEDEIHEFVTHIADSIEEFDDEDYEASYELQHEAVVQIQDFSLIITNAIITQFSEDF